MKRALITGGTGFVGSWMKRTQPDGIQGVYLSCDDYNSYRWDKAGVNIVHPTDKLRYNYIVHLAPISPTVAIRMAGQAQARLLYCSSGIVYHPENNTAYRYNKILGERACLDAQIDVVIARLFAFYGDGLDRYKAYTEFTEAAKANKPIEIHGDGNTVRSYMHGSELGAWMWAILLNGKAGESYDVGSDEPITILQLARQIKHEHNSDAGITILGGDDPMPFYLPPNTAKTKELLKKGET